MYGNLATGRANVVRVVRPGPECSCSTVRIPTPIRPCQRQGHDVGDEEVRLPEHEHSRMQIDLKFVNRRVVTNRRFDQQNGTSELDGIRLKIDRRDYQIRVGSVPCRR